MDIHADRLLLLSFEYDQSHRGWRARVGIVRQNRVCAEVSLTGGPENLPSLAGMEEEIVRLTASSLGVVDAPLEVSQLPTPRSIVSGEV